MNEPPPACPRQFFTTSAALLAVPGSLLCSSRTLFHEPEEAEVAFTAAVPFKWQHADRTVANARCGGKKKRRNPMNGGKSATKRCLIAGELSGPLRIVIDAADLHGTALLERL
jgi:hypothetical protein